MPLQMSTEERCAIRGDVTKDVSVTPGSNNDMLISGGALELDLTLDWCKRVQTGQILL